MPRSYKISSCPTVLYFFGGGWVEGRIDQFKWHANCLAKKGIGVVCAEYRVSSRHGTTPFEAVIDGADAYKWLCQNASHYGVDVDRLAIAGNSAGGHVAACIALCELPGFNIRESYPPRALILLNPVLDLFTATKELEFSSGELKLIKALERQDMKLTLSPQQNISSDIPPTYMVYGGKDPLYAQGERFANTLSDLGRDMELEVVDDQRHSFFIGKPWRRWLVDRIDRYLKELGWSTVV